MTMKAAKPTLPFKTTADVPADEHHQAEVDAFVERNRDELNASISRARREVAEGIQSGRTIDGIIADGRRRYRAG